MIFDDPNIPLERFQLRDSLPVLSIPFNDDWQTAWESAEEVIVPQKQKNCSRWPGLSPSSRSSRGYDGRHRRLSSPSRMQSQKSSNNDAPQKRGNSPKPSRPSIPKFSNANANANVRSRGRDLTIYSHSSKAVPSPDVDKACVITLADATNANESLLTSKKLRSRPSTSPSQKSSQTQQRSQVGGLKGPKPDWRDFNTKDYSDRDRASILEKIVSDRSERRATTPTASVHVNNSLLSTHTLVKPSLSSSQPHNGKLHSDTSSTERGNSSRAHRSNKQQGKPSATSPTTDAGTTRNQRDEKGSKCLEWSRRFGDAGRQSKQKKVDEKARKIEKALIPPPGQSEGLIDIIDAMLNKVVVMMVEQLKGTICIAREHRNGVLEALARGSTYGCSLWLTEERLQSLQSTVRAAHAVNRQPIEPALPQGKTSSVKLTQHLLKPASSSNPTEREDGEEAILRVLEFLTCVPNYRPVDESCSIILWLLASDTNTRNKDNEYDEELRNCKNGIETSLNHMVSASGMLGAIRRHHNDIRERLVDLTELQADRGPFKEKRARDRWAIMLSMRHWYALKSDVFAVPMSDSMGTRESLERSTIAAGMSESRVTEDVGPGTTTGHTSRHRRPFAPVASGSIRFLGSSRNLSQQVSDNGGTTPADKGTPRRHAQAALQLDVEVHKGECILLRIYITG